MLGGDPRLDKEVRSEVRQRGRWRRDFLIFLAGLLVLIVVAVLVSAL